MNDLDKIRAKIDDIDHILVDCFNKRFKLVEEVIKFKKENNINIENKNREEEIINKHLAHVDKKYQEYYKLFMKQLFEISRSFQKDEL